MFTFTGQNVAVLKDIGATCHASGKTVFQLRKPGSVATNTASCQRYPVVSHLKSCSLEQRSPLQSLTQNNVRTKMILRFKYKQIDDECFLIPSA